MGWGYSEGHHARKEGFLPLLRHLSGSQLNSIVSCFSSSCRRERENHAADDSEGGALDMCCSERLPGESSQHSGPPPPQASEWRARVPDVTGAEVKPG